MLWQILVIVYVCGAIHGAYCQWRFMQHPLLKIKMLGFRMTYGKTFAWFMHASAMFYTSLCWPIHWTFLVLHKLKHGVK